MEVRTTTASSSNNLFENVEDRGIEIKCVNESHDANKSLDNHYSTDDDDEKATILKKKNSIAMDGLKVKILNTYI